MALDYRFSIASALDAKEILKLALAELQLTPEERCTPGGEPMETQGPGFLASASPTSAPVHLLGVASAADDDHRSPG